MLACRRTEHRGKLETLAQQGHAARKRSGSREMEGPETKLILVCDERRGTGSDYYEDREGLYERTGFQQPVQGKRGENCGENRVLCNIFVLCYLKDII